MRGPFERLKYDLRRTFECPKCGLRERVWPCFTNRLCKCQNSSEATEAKWMRMVDEGDGPKSPRAIQAAQAAAATVAASQVEASTKEASSIAELEQESGADGKTAPSSQHESNPASEETATPADEPKRDEQGEGSD